MKPLNDADILNVRAVHPVIGPMRFERARQDRRIYYRIVDGSGGCGLTDAHHARLTIDHWRNAGWLTTDTPKAAETHQLL
jgi:hypothetical protein